MEVNNLNGVEWPISTPYNITLGGLYKIMGTREQNYPNFNLYHMYEVQQSLFLTMVGLNSEDWLTHE